MLNRQYFSDGLEYLMAHFNLTMGEERIKVLWQELYVMDEQTYREALESIVKTEVAINANVSLVALINKHKDLVEQNKRALYKNRIYENVKLEDQSEWKDFDEFWRACKKEGCKDKFFVKAMWLRFNGETDMTFADIVKNRGNIEKKPCKICKKDFKRQYAKQEICRDCVIAEYKVSHKMPPEPQNERSVDLKPKVVSKEGKPVSMA